MKPKFILIVILALTLAACAKLVPPGSLVTPIGVQRTLTPIGSPVLSIPIAAPTIEPIAPLVSPLASPLESPLESPLAAPDFNGQEALVQQATNDLSNRLGLSTGEIAVLSVSQVELSIPDVACVADDANTSSAVIPAQTIGWEIVLTANQINYTYHIHARDMVLCTSLP